MRFVKWFVTLFLVTGVMVADADADGYVSPFVGVNFGGDAGARFAVAVDDPNKVTYGLSFGKMSGGIFGGELDLAYTKNFFGDGGDFIDNSLLSVMPSLVIGIPIGGQSGAGVRPYATAGIGLLRREVRVRGFDEITANDMAYSVGLGAMGFVSTHFGIRADYRYFRNFKVDGDDLADLSLERGTFDYSRATVGLVLRF